MRKNYVMNYGVGSLWGDIPEWIMFLDSKVFFLREKGPSGAGNRVKNGIISDILNIWKCDVGKSTSKVFLWTN